MKKIFALIATAIVVILSSCTKENATIALFQDEQEVFQTKTYGLPLRFQAEDGLTEATVAIYDKDFVQIAVENIILPETSDEVYEMVFVSETNPEYLYTDGLENADADTGYLHIGGKQIHTKAGVDDAILIVIRK